MGKPTNKLTPVSSGNNQLGSGEPAYLRLWKQLKELREENSNVVNYLKGIASRFESTIKPLEIQYTQSIYTQCEVLIKHYEGAKLDTAELSLLGLWITEHQTTLGEHPFAQHLPLEPLYSRWQAVLTAGDSAVDKHLASFAASSHEKTQAKRDVRGSTSRAPSPFPDPKERVTSPLDESNSNSAGKKADEQRKTPDDRRKTKASSSHSKKLDQAMESLLSIDKVFRKLAHALHPDREPIEAKKIEKDQLMRECLEARDTNDISMLLILYERHIGSVEQLLGGADLNELEAVLEKEIAELRSERLQLQSSGTLQSQILERYRSDSHSETDRRFKDHAKKLQERLYKVSAQTVRLETHKGLLEELTLRREVELDRMVIRELTGSVTS